MYKRSYSLLSSKWIGCSTCCYPDLCQNLRPLRCSLDLQQRYGHRCAGVCRWSPACIILSVRTEAHAYTSNAVAHASDVFACGVQPPGRVSQAAAAVLRMRRRTPHAPSAFSMASTSAEADRLKDEGNKLVAAKKFAKAIECYTQALALDPSSRVLWANRSAAHLELKQAKEAIADAQKAIDVDASWPKGYYRLGTALESSKRFEEAINAYTKGQELEPGPSWAMSIARCRSSVISATEEDSKARKPATLSACAQAAEGMLDLPSAPSLPSLTDLCSSLYDGCLRVEHRAGKGRCLVAAKDIPAFSEVFTDPAACWYPSAADNLGASIPGVLERPFTGPYASLDVRTLGLQLAPWSAQAALQPQDSAAGAGATDATSVRGTANMSAVSQPMPAAAFLMPVMRSNAIGLVFDEELPEASRRVCALCPVASLMNHSCAPNVGYIGVWDRKNSCPAVRVYSEVDLRSGDELTITYVGRHVAKEERQRRLSRGYGFTCACARCCAAHDDTAVFACPACKVGRVYLGACSCMDCNAAVVPAGAALPGGPWDKARQTTASIAYTRAKPTAANSFFLCAEPSLQFPGLHIADESRFEALRTYMAQLWASLHAHLDAVTGKGSSASKAAATGHSPADACTISSLVADSPFAPIQGFAVMCDCVLFTGHIHAICASLPAPQTYGVTQAQQAAWATAAATYYSRAAQMCSAVFGPHSPRTLMAKACVAKPPKTKAAVEQAESRRVQGSASWVVHYGMAKENAERWSACYDKQSEGAEATATAAKKLVSLTKDIQATQRFA